MHPRKCNPSNVIPVNVIRRSIILIFRLCTRFVFIFVTATFIPSIVNFSTNRINFVAPN